MEEEQVVVAIEDAIGGVDREAVGVEVLCRDKGRERPPALDESRGRLLRPAGRSGTCDTDPSI